MKKIKEILKIIQEYRRGVKIKEKSFVNRGDGQPTAPSAKRKITQHAQKKLFRKR